MTQWHQVVAELGWPSTVTNVTELQPGFSGAAVFKATLSDGRVFAVKRLPSDCNLNRIHEIHRTMNGGLNVVDLVTDPVLRGSLTRFTTTASIKLASLHRFTDGTTLMRKSKRWWEAWSWIDGQPLERNAEIESVSAGAAALAGFHQCSLGLHQRQQIPAGLIERMRRLGSRELPLQLADARKLADRFALGDDGSFAQSYANAVSMLRHRWKAVSVRLATRLRPWADRKLQTMYVLRDVHREHVLFDGDQAGFIDFDAVRIDTPALDLARWIGSFDADRRAWSAALAEYRRQCSSWISPSSGLLDAGRVHSDGWEELLPLLNEIGQWVGLVNWVTWVAENRRFQAPIDLIRGRIDFLCHSLAAEADFTNIDA